LTATKGKTIGGSSAINFGNIIFPSKVGINTWEALGNPGWGWDDFAAYIKEIHMGHGPLEKTREFLKGIKWNKGDQGASGPLQISYGKDYLPYHAAWLEKFKNLGFELTGDPIKGAGVGVFINPGGIDPERHTRSHAGVAYYAPMQ
jgi:choline dehydrogenase-like flavoprotein